MTRRQKHRLEYLLFRAIEILIHFLPMAVLEILAQIVVFFGFNIIKYRRDVALENLRYAFPEKSPQEREAIAYRSFHHFALLIFEFIKLSGWNDKKLAAKVKFTFDPQAQAILDTLKKNGGILVSGHFGNWEMAIAMLASRYFEMPAVVQKRQQNRFIDEKTIAMRTRWGVRMIHSRGAIRKLRTALNEQRVVALLADQDAGESGAFVPFMNRAASTPAGPAMLLLRSRASLNFSAAIRTGRYQFSGVIVPIEYHGGYELTHENIAAVTAGFTRELEALVRKHPEQYLWMHRRWKTPFEVKSKK